MPAKTQPGGFRFARYRKPGQRAGRGRRRPLAALAAGCGGLAVCAGLAACGGTSSSATAAPAPAAVGEPVSLNTSVASSAATWAVVVMGGSAASNNNFWQLFVRPAGTGTWKLATPPGVADNGGLVLAGPPGAGAGPGGSVTVGFRPSIMLTFTPFTASTDNGQTWNSGNPIYAVLADVPGALAAEPGSGRLLALLKDGTLRSGTLAGTNWTPVTSLKDLATTPDGRRCGLASLTGTGFTASGAALVTGTCTHPGVVGVWVDRAGPWTLAGPSLPGSLAGQPVSVLAAGQFPRQRPAGAGTKAGGASPAVGLAAVLEVGPPRSASLVTIWSTDDAAHWQVSAPYQLPAGARPAAVSFGPAGLAAAILAGGAGGSAAGGGVMIAGAGSSWQELPKLPSGTEALAAGPNGSIQAMAANHSVLTVWQAGPGAAGTGWTKVQTMNVPIQYGSSG